jgi:hypothetical protein
MCPLTDFSSPFPQMGSAWLLGAKFDQLFRDYDNYISGPGSTTITGHTLPTGTGRDEL